MARALTAVGVALALLVAGLALAVFLSRDEDNIQVDNLLAERFTRDVALSRGGEVDLGRIASFDWSRVLIVAPETPRSEISRRLGYEWTGTIGFQTGELLILLRSDGKIARFLDYRGEGTFEGIDRPFAELPRDQAVFRVGNDLVITPS